jgi:type VI secretion system protein ImpL
MIRRLLFILFLYTLLVWIAAAYLHTGDVHTLVNQGLLWTGIGVALLLLWLIFERVFRWWQVRRAARAAKPVQAVAAGPQAHPDDLAFLALLREAEQRLAQAPVAPGARPSRLFDFPIYLVLGPERGGKTSILQNSGIEPALLAGQVASGGSAIMSTRLANLWIAQQSLFIEIGGKIFGGEARRFGELLTNLTPHVKQPLWSRLLKPTPAPDLRGVILVFDAQKFTGTPEPSELDRYAQQIRERLFSAAAVFGPDLPVYTVFTRVDGLRYFPEFFGRLADAEAGQVFGVLRASAAKDPAQDRIWAEAETKRLNQQFSSLFLRLSDRRLLALAQETKHEARSAIYEFPREFKRIRTHLVQFLIDVFKPDPLVPGPQLRGFFFSGTRKSERVAPPPADASSVYLGMRGPGPAADATQIFSPEMKTTYGKSAPEPGSGRQVEQWMFVTEFFGRILRSDRPVVARPITPLDRYRTVAVGVAAGVALLISLLWTVSWFGNFSLISQFQSSIGAVRRGNDLSTANLRALDELHREIVDLEKRAPIRLHWGLYTGDVLMDRARRAYFAQLRRLSLVDINEQLVSELQHASASSGGAGTALTYDRLKTHRTITALACPVDDRLVSRVLKTSATEAFPALTDEQKLLLNTQLDYYASELGKTNKPPVSLTEDKDAETAARSFLRQSGGLDQQLNGLLATVDRQVKTLAVADYADNYQAVLTGQAEIRGAFSKQGLSLFEDLVNKGNFGSGAEGCVMGEMAALGAGIQSAEVKRQLLSMYYQQYAAAWRSFLVSYKVIRYAGPDDAARRLRILAGPTSPLLAVVRMVAANTNFQLPKPGEPSWWDKGLQKAGLGSVVDNKNKAAKAADQVEQAIGVNTPGLTTADLARLFQPVAFTTPPAADRLVSDNNADYIKGLRGLDDSLDALGRASAADRATAIPQALAALTQAKGSETALADKFFDVGNQGLNKQLGDLLVQPIDLAATWIPINSGRSTAEGKNRDLAQFCKEMAPILSKYPFSASSQSDATLIDIAKAFSPTDGYVTKYIQQSGADLVVRKGPEFVPNPALQGMKVAPELLLFLNRAQELTDVLFAEGGMMQPKLRYVLRPVAGQNAPGQNIVVRLALDGKELSSQDPLQKTFYWPAPAGSTAGAEGTVQSGTFTTGFGRFEGLWGVFRLFQNADDRTFGAKTVQWSEIRGLGKSVVAQPLNPPVKVEFVEFPGGKDLFNPIFFESLQCPRKAVTVN